MKNILKFILSTLIGALIGGALVGGIIFILEGREGMADMMNKVSELPMIDFLVPILLAFAAMFTAIVLHIVLHEGGHLLMGFVTGYRFTSFRIASIAFIRREGRTSVRRYKLATISRFFEIGMFHFSPVCSYLCSTETTPYTHDREGEDAAARAVRCEL